MSFVMQSELVAPDSGSGSLPRYDIESIGGGGRVATLETMWSFFLDAVNDPDSALRKDPNFLETMMRHPQVSACMNLREQNVASMLTRVDSPEEPVNAEKAKAAAKYISTVWASIDNKDALFQQMQLAVLHGGVGHEWMWQAYEDGTQRPRRFFPVHKTRFLFDRQGQMCLKTRRQMVWGGYLGVTPTNPGHPTNLPLGKFTYHVYEQMPGSWNRPDDEGFIYFGRGEDEDLYDLVVRDLASWYMQMQWLQQYGNPPRLLYHPEPFSAWANVITKLGQRLMKDNLIPVYNTIQEGGHRAFELVNAEVPHPSFDAFGAIRKRHYDDIEAILLGAVGALSQQDKGGYASHKSRQQSGPDLLATRDATRICSTINSQLVPAMIKYGPQPLRDLDPADLPKIVLFNEDDVDAEALEKAVKLVPVGKKFIYRRLKIDEPTEGEETVFHGNEQDPLKEIDGLAGGKEPGEDGEDEPRQPIGENDKSAEEDPK